MSAHVPHNNTHKTVQNRHEMRGDLEWKVGSVHNTQAVDSVNLVVRVDNAAEIFAHHSGGTNRVPVGTEVRLAVVGPVVKASIVADSVRPGLFRNKVEGFRQSLGDSASPLDGSTLGKSVELVGEVARVDDKVRRVGIAASDLDRATAEWEKEPRVIAENLGSRVVRIVEALGHGCTFVEDPVTLSLENFAKTVGASSGVFVNSVLYISVNVALEHVAGLVGIAVLEEIAEAGEEDGLAVSTFSTIDGEGRSSGGLVDEVLAYGKVDTCLDSSGGEELVGTDTRVLEDDGSLDRAESDEDLTTSSSCMGVARAVAELDASGAGLVAIREENLADMGASED